MNPMDMQMMLDHWERMSLQPIGRKKRRKLWQDCCIVTAFDGAPTPPCDWIVVRDKNKLYAMHAPEAECICKGKARQRYEFGVKSSVVVTHKEGLIVGARTFPGNPYDGHVLCAQLEQTSILLQDVGHTPKEVIVDLGYRGVDADNPDVKILHRGKEQRHGLFALGWAFGLLHLLDAGQCQVNSFYRSIS